MSDPVAGAYRMPAEWAPHQRCWMIWPCRAETFGSELDAARVATGQVARALVRHEALSMLVRPEDLEDARLRCGEKVELLPHPGLVDSWMRDVGPSFVHHRDTGQLAGVDWIFNAWGEDYSGPNDDAVAQWVLERLGVERLRAPLVLEGGSIHVDGEGTLLTSEQCLLNPNRNPTLDQAGVEAALGRYLGVKKMIWLGQGLEDDMTDGHVDNLACFVRPGVVLALDCDDPADGNYAALKDNLQRLQAARDARGRPLQVISVPQPAPRWQGHSRLALSYINFYIANGAVLMPSFDDPMDATALGIVQEAFPERQVVQIPVLPILAGGGGIHCITQQQPEIL